MTKKKVDDLFFLLFCEKNSDGTKHLRLKGKELFQRFGRRLTQDDMYPLADFLKKHEEIISLDLCYNNIGDEGITILAKEYFAHPKGANLQYLNLLHCDLGPNGLAYLSSLKHLKLKMIRLLGNKLGPEGARYIGRLIENFRTLETLDIGETDLTLESVECLLMVIEKSLLKSLNMSRIVPNSYYSKYDDSTLADDLGILLKLNTSLEVLRAQKCEFDGHDMEMLLGGLRVHTNLSLLDLAANRIGNHGVEILTQWLRTRPKLTALRIASNGITTRGAKALSIHLPFSRIRLLDLQNNKIGDQGLADLFDSLKKSTQMRVLYIWGNDLGNVALAKLERCFDSGCLVPENVDVKIYYVDGVRCAAFNPINQLALKKYSIQLYGVAPELKIIRNKKAHPDALPRALLNFEFIDRYPPVDESLGLKGLKH
ncbi:leucine-rich repeat-containing protein 34-like isoform X2 [Anthonomus grandis grandis]|uniref:leucine-rich repeat-containing protein 34-like isoform X2 n=1 Tax=Anthonomus grandis grandis TaxID=2921223 RepID=UPI00216694BD|nr:leucine-rich repeat-containing protein 34-like isoform X2 [Anthonomus grandis grandis]